MTNRESLFLFICRILFMRDGSGQPEEVTTFRRVFRVERFTTYGVLSRSVTSLRVTFRGRQKTQQQKSVSRRATSISAAPAASTKTISPGEDENSLRPISESDQQQSSPRRSRRSVDNGAETLETFTACVKQEISLWLALLVELWCGNLAAFHLRDPQLVQQAAENALIINAYIMAGIVQTNK